MGGGGAETPRGLKSALQDGAGAGGMSRSSRTWSFSAGLVGRFDGVVVDVRMLEEDNLTAEKLKGLENRDIPPAPAPSSNPVGPASWPV